MTVSSSDIAHPRIDLDGTLTQLLAWPQVHMIAGVEVAPKGVC